jgi:hypothetical protein
LRDKVSVFYYPSMVAEDATFKKAILLFDEIHFIDRPSFSFGKFCTIACPSPLRQCEQSFREGGIPLYVHHPKDGPVMGEFLEQVQCDINDVEFLRRFQRGLQESLVFRDQQIAHGNYGEVGSHEAVLLELLKVNVDTDFGEVSKPEDLLYDDKIQPMRFKTPAERAKSFIYDASKCSAMVNFALNASQHQGFAPLADSVVYQRLLGVKYARAVSNVGKSEPQIHLSDLSFAILDELVPAERLEQMTYGDVVKYRKESAAAREAFLEHLSTLHAKQSTITDDDYAKALTTIVNTEILPEARTFKNKMAAIHDNLFGSLVAKAVSYIGGSDAAMQIFGGISWGSLLHLAGLAGAAGAAIGKVAIEAKVAERAARRDCAISYVLGLDK